MLLKLALDSAAPLLITGGDHLFPRSMFKLQLVFLLHVSMIHLVDMLVTPLSACQVVMKRSGGGNGYTRREIECIPKAVKATNAKGASTLAAVTPAEEEAGDDEGASPPSRPPPLTRVVDEEIVRGILSGTVSTAAKLGGRQGEKDEAPSSPVSSRNDSFAADGSEESSAENSSGGEEWREDSSDDEELPVAGAGGSKEEEEEDMKPLKIGSIVIPARDVEDYDDITEEASKADEIEWEYHQARQRETRRRQRGVNGRGDAGYAKRGGTARGGGGGGGGRRKWRAGSDDMNGEVEIGGAYEDDDDIRRKPRSPRNKAGQERVVSPRRGSDLAGGSGGGGSAVRGRPGGMLESGPRQGSFTGGRGGGGGGRGGGGVNGSWMDARRSQDASGGGGRGRGRGSGPSTAPPVRTTPYKWRTSLADQGGATEGASVQQQQQQQQQKPSGGNSDSQSWVASSPASARSGGRGTPAVDDGGQVRGFRARFGGGVTSRPEDSDSS